MNPVFLLIFMIGLGALIGGVTNSLAIKMLFRPYRPIYIGKFRIPFTPGLIPKRREELAKQLGKMVVNHLLTPDGLRKKLEGAIFQDQMTNWAQKEIRPFLQSSSSLQEFLKGFGIAVSPSKVETSVTKWVNGHVEQVLSTYRTQTLDSLLSDQWKAKTIEGTDKLADYLQEKIVQYFESREGRQKVSALIENYLDNQGFFGNMISSFMGSESVTDRIYPAILRYVSDPEMNIWLKGMLQHEREQLMNQPVGYFEAKIGNRAIGSIIGELSAKFLPVEEWLKRPVSEWTAPMEGKISNEMIPLFIRKATEYLSVRIENLMETLHLAEIVQEQVKTFEVERLEEMVLGISRREFKMITYLGALLGGVVGLFQGMIVLFFG